MRKQRADDSHIKHSDQLILADIYYNFELYNQSSVFIP